METWLLKQTMDRGWDNKVFNSKNVYGRDSANEDSERSEGSGRKGI